MTGAKLKSLVLVNCLVVLFGNISNYHSAKNQLTKTSSQLDSMITNQLEDIKQHEQVITNSLKTIEDLNKQLDQKLAKIESLQRQIEELSVKTDIPPELKNYIIEVANANGYRPELLLGIIENESKWDSNAKSDTNDYGLCQINSYNFNEYRQDIINKYGCFNEYNPYISIDMMVGILNNFNQYFYNIYGYYPNESCLLFAYNTGKLKSTFQGNNYTTKVLNYTEEYRIMLDLEQQILDI